MVNIEGLDKYAVAAALFNAAAPQGMGFLAYQQGGMTAAEMEKNLVDRPERWRFDFDYLMGRLIKVGFLPDDTEFDERLFDRQYGQGAAEMVIASLRATGDPDNAFIQYMHRSGLAGATERVRDWIANPPQGGEKTEDGIPTITMGLTPGAVSALEKALAKVA